MVWKRRHPSDTTIGSLFFKILSCHLCFLKRAYNFEEKKREDHVQNQSPREINKCFKDVHLFNLYRAVNQEVTNFSVD